MIRKSPIRAPVQRTSVSRNDESPGLENHLRHRPVDGEECPCAEAIAYPIAAVRSRVTLSAGM
jgi:hypothetical protein